MFIYRVLEEAEKLGVSHLISAKYIQETEMSCVKQVVKYDPNYYNFIHIDVLPGTKKEDVEKVIEIRKKLDVDLYT